MQIHENFQKNLKSQCPISFNAFEIIYDGNPQLYCLKNKSKWYQWKYLRTKECVQDTEMEAYPGNTVYNCQDKYIWGQSPK